MSASSVVRGGVVSLTLSFVAALGASAQSPTGRPLAIEDYYRVKTVGNPDLSPDGKWVAFTVSTRVEATNDNTSEVWLVASDGSAPARRVSADGANAAAPAWLDDGRLRFSAGGRAFALDPATPAEVTEDAHRRPRRLRGRRTGRWCGRGGRGGGGGARDAEPRREDGRAIVRDTPPPKREPVYESEFAKRHEERFKGVEFDWMDFQRDAAPFPLAEPRRPASQSSAGDLPHAERWRASDSSRISGCVPPVRTGIRAGTMLAFTADSTYRNEKIYGRSDVWTVTADGALKKLTSRTAYSYAGAQYLARRHVDSHHALDADRRGDREEDGQRRSGRRRARAGGRRPRGQSHRGVGLSAVGARSGAATGSTSTSRAASAARRICSACRRAAARSSR